MESIEEALDAVTALYTLGPTGTNCEYAANTWFERRGRQGRVHLCPTLETAVEQLPYDGTAALLGCVVYPDLHHLVFQNLHRLTLAETFVVPTHRMVLAARDGREPITVATHPAPQSLVPERLTRVLTTSNARAAQECAAGEVDGCVTTLPAARIHDLRVITDFGPVPMGFTVHLPSPAQRRMLR
ncbi:hypothetical protein AB0M35_26120 [Micromonospora sp. NPDC051196]|uniref:hypothetical protein n=1 Tax=Micromonospora sp. NPDC051196 TaxID=3155281 RepID=UPI00343FFB6D